jgi:hypothetical protein
MNAVWPCRYLQQSPVKMRPLNLCAQDHKAPSKSEHRNRNDKCYCQRCRFESRKLKYLSRDVLGGYVTHSLNMSEHALT